MFYRKEGNIYMEYKKTARCPYPDYTGVINLQKPPEKESQRFKLIRCCSIDPKIHTFSHNVNNVGYPVSIDFSIEK